MQLMTMLDISLNGERVATDAPTLHALLQARGYDFRTAFACAVNNAFVPRPQWPERALQSGDRIDIVTPITGG
jgi:sulfur carrier protein